MCLLAAVDKWPTEHRQRWEDHHITVSNWGESLLKFLTAKLACEQSVSIYQSSHPSFFLLLILFTSLPQDKPYLRTEGNSPSYHHGDASPLLNAVSIVTMKLWLLCAARLVLIVDVLYMSTQFTGTEMPCEDLGPSPSIPTSGKMVYTLRLGM